jgi:hypothetical protein
MVLYANDNNDQPPPNLKALITTHFINDHTLQCPSTQTHRESDYFYFPPGPKDDPKALVLCDYKTNHGGEGRAVLVAGFAVRWMKESDFQAELSKPYNSKFAQALREAEGP